MSVPSPQLNAIGSQINAWARGDASGEETVIDVLAELRLFSEIHAVDFDNSLKISHDHFLAERG